MNKWFYWVRVLYPISQFHHNFLKNLSGHVVNRHSSPKLHLMYKGLLCFKKFSAVYKDRKHKNTHIAFVSEHQKVNPTITFLKLMIRILRRSCVLVNNYLWFLRFKEPHKPVHFCIEKSQYAKFVNERINYFFNNRIYASKVIFTFVFTLKNTTDVRKLSCFMHTRTIQCRIE